MNGQAIPRQGGKIHEIKEPLGQLGGRSVDPAFIRAGICLVRYIQADFCSLPELVGIPALNDFYHHYGYVLYWMLVSGTSGKTG